MLEPDVATPGGVAPSDPVLGPARAPAGSEPAASPGRFERAGIPVESGRVVAQVTAAMRWAIGS